MGNLGELSKLLAQLQGKNLHIPNLRPIFEKWPFAVNKHLEALRQYVDEVLERYT